MRRVRERLVSNPRADYLVHWAFNLGMVALFAIFAERFLRDIVATARLSSILLLVLTTLRAVLYLTRRQPRLVSVDPFAWTVAIAGTWTPLLFRPSTAEEHLLGQSLQLVGVVLQLLAVISLNRSIGIVAANRGVRTTGMYRLIRHPLYASYVFSYTGFVLSQPSTNNYIVAAFWAFFQFARIHYEEQVLTLDPAYLEYTRRTRWRIIPFIF